jgi:hypothetical protein
MLELRRLRLAGKFCEQNENRSIVTQGAIIGALLMQLHGFCPNQDRREFSQQWNSKVPLACCLNLVSFR